MKQKSHCCGLKIACIYLLLSFTCFNALATDVSNNMLFLPGKHNVVRDTIPEKDTVETNYYHLNWSYVRSYGPDLMKVLKRPASRDKRDLKRAGIIAAGTGILLLSDREINHFMTRNQSDAVSSAAKVVEPFGNTFPPLILTGLYLTGFVTKNRKLEHASLMTAKSLVISTLVYIAAKSTVRRQRPFRTDNPHNFGPPFGQKGYNSFPSGHTNTIMALATALSIEYKHIVWVSYVSYSVAALTALSRLYQNRHWASDVFFGGALSHFVTRAAYKKTAPKPKEKMIIP